MMEMDEPTNVLGQPLQPCGMEPLTGFYRDGCCNTSDSDAGQHTICVEVTQKFLEYSRFRGNDLMTPIETFSFSGLKSGDRWCLSAKRWLEAYEFNMAPKVCLAATHYRALEVVPLSLLKQYALDWVD